MRAYFIDKVPESDADYWLHSRGDCKLAPDRESRTPIGEFGCDSDALVVAQRVYDNVALCEDCRATEDDEHERNTIDAAINATITTNNG